MPDLTKKNKCPTSGECVEIQECLNRAMAFNAIAARIGKDQATVLRGAKAASLFAINV